MTERTGRKNSRQLISGNFAGEACFFRPGGQCSRSDLYCRAYRVSDLMNSPSLDILPARSYFPTVLGQLLPNAEKENSRARACRFALTSYKVRNPVGAAAQTGAAAQAVCERFPSALYGQYLLP